MAGFPNLFAVNAPGSPSVFTNMMPAIEHHVSWIIECLDYLRSRNIDVIEATSEAEDSWLKHCEEVAAGHLRSTAYSWYTGETSRASCVRSCPTSAAFPFTRRNVRKLSNGVTRDSLCVRLGPAKTDFEQRRSGSHQHIKKDRHKAGPF